MSNRIQKTLGLWTFIMVLASLSILLSVSPAYAVGTANISIDKITSNSTPNVGQQFSYIITVSNAGPDNATNMLVTDMLPPGLTFNSYTANQGTYNSVTGIWNVGAMPIDALASLSLYVTPTASVAGTLVINTATITEDQFDTEPYMSSVIITVSGPLTVVTPTDTSITATTATLGGDATSDGGASIFERGVLYSLTSTNSNPTIGGTGVTEVDDPSGGTGVFTESVSGLTPGSGYSFVAFATNSAGTAYTSPVSTFTTLARANPTISVAQQPAAAVVGDSIAAKATVSGGFNPTGTVTFNLYNNSTGTGTPLFSDTETLAGGDAVSAGYTPTATGTDYWVATYNGDANNNSSTSSTAAAPVTVQAATPTINVAQQPASAVVGDSIAAKATVSGGFNPTGTVTFKLYNNAAGSGTPLFTNTETLAGGDAVSAGYAPTATGTDYWVATYNGDANNASVASGTATAPVTVTPATPAISVTQQPASLAVGQSMAAQATMSGGFNPTGTVTFNLYNNSTGTGTPLFSDTETLAGGDAVSAGYTPTATGTDYWVATYNGDANNNSSTSSTVAAPVVVNYSYCSISGTVWYDANNDGIDDGESVVAEVTVVLTGTDVFGDAVSMTTTTGANGNYSFTSLNPGNYIISFTLPSGYSGFTAEGAGGASDSAINSHVNPTTGATALLDLTAGDSVQYINAGLTKTGPMITSADSTAFTVGSSGSFTITTTSNPTPSISESGALPVGVILTDNGNGTATLVGTPAAGTGGSCPIIITASNGVLPNATQSFMLEVNQCPDITSANNTTFTVGGNSSFTVTTDGYPTPALSELGALPAGVVFTDNGNGTAILGGTPAAGTGGSCPITITASNGALPNDTQSFTLLCLDDNATLSALEYNNIPVPGFTPATYTYSVTLPAGTATVPTVSAAIYNSNATDQITQVTGLPGSATVVVTAQDNTTKLTYTINFSVAPPAQGLAISPSSRTSTGLQRVTIGNSNPLSVWQSVYYSIAGDPETVSGATYLSRSVLPFTFILSVSDTVYARVYDISAGWGSLSFESYTIQTLTPAITTPVYTGVTSVSGTSAANATIGLTINGGVTAYPATANVSGYWTVSGLPSLAAGDTISVTAQIAGETSSQAVTAIVQAVTSSGGGSGGGGSTTQSVNNTGAATLSPPTGGTVWLGNNEAGVTIPDGALQGSSDVNVTIGAASSSPSAPSGYTLLGSVYQLSVGGTGSYVFNNPVTLTFSFDPSQIPSGETPTVFNYDSTNNHWVNIGGAVNWSNDTITATTGQIVYEYAVMAEIPQPASLAITFFDVPSSYWAYNAITSLSGQGYITGYPDGTLRPGNPITRAEFCACLDKALKLQAYNPQSPGFIDITPDDWYYGSVESAVYARIANGYGNNNFAPARPITREELACILVNALGRQSEAMSGMNSSTGFTDDPSISPWARGFVVLAVKDDLLKGYPNGSFNPQGDATRAEACAMIENFLKVYSPGQ
jgi:uncharacterized repeat protein (TIGR01451 family)